MKGIEEEVNIKGSRKGKELMKLSITRLADKVSYLYFLKIGVQFFLNSQSLPVSHVK
jgi:hypothetical protein